VVADDRSGDELREERDVQAEVDRVPERLHLGPVDVDQIRERVEREEGDAEREVHRGKGHGAHPERGEPDVQVVDQEVGVLEGDEQAEVGGDGGAQHPLLPGRDLERPAEQIVDGNRADHHEGERRLAPRVEEQARDEQEGVPRASTDHEVRAEDDRKEQEEEDRRAEQHGVCARRTGSPSGYLPAPTERQQNRAASTRCSARVSGSELDSTLLPAADWELPRATAGP
jgi:hypothetical protein